MDNPTLPPQAPLPTDCHPFKNWTDCLIALKKLPYPPTELDQQSIIARLQSSLRRSFIVFEFLWWRRNVRATSKFFWFESIALQMLGNGEPAPNLASLPAPADAGRWVFHELREINSLSEWKKYIASGRHLWLLHAILQCASNRPALIEAILALAECIEHLHNSAARNKPVKPLINAEDPQWIVRLLKSRISSQSDLSKSFIECVFALNATAGLSQELREDSNSLRSQLRKMSEDLKSETDANTNAENRKLQLQAELDQTKKELADKSQSLEDERKHNIRTGGFGGVAKQETVSQVMAIVRQGASHRLESIRQYADREKPNREEILDLVNEIEKHLAGVEERIVK